MDSGELVGVGAFAQLSGLTVETLRHYHQVGLLVPAEVDDRTGYRRYGLRQLPRARALAVLRDVGMPLGDAAAIIEATDRGARRARLVEHRRRLAEASRRAAGRVDAMDRMIEREDARDSPLRINEGTLTLSDERLARELLGTLDRTDFGHLGVRHEGKVRDSYLDGDVRTIVTKEPLREWVAERGFRGDGEAPVLTDEVRIATATRYILLAEELTQRPFEAPEFTAAERVAGIFRD